MQLSVIIVSYNVKFFLEQCLCSLTRAIERIDAEVWVVDNASTDGSLEYLQGQFPAIYFVANTINVGFGKANNQALQKCRGRYVLFLNPDTIVPEDCLLKSLAFLEANQQAGALGIRMIDGSGKFLPESKRAFPSPLTSFYKLAGISKLFPSSKIFSRYALGYLDENKNHQVDVLAGAFLLGRKDLLLALGGFDEAFFMYGEDIDLSYRIQKSGFQNFYFSESAIIHFKGESTSKGSLNYVKMFYDAMIVFVKKHYQGSDASFFAFFLQIAIWIRAGFSAVARLIYSIKKTFTKKSSGEIKKQRQAIIVGTMEECEEVINVFDEAGLKVSIKERVEPREQEDNQSIISKLQTLSSKNELNEIIFCQGYLDYKSIIEMVQNLPPGISVRFHGKGTNSIVGSDSKDTAGEFVAVSIDK